MKTETGAQGHEEEGGGQPRRHDGKKGGGGNREKRQQAAQESGGGTAERAKGAAKLKGDESQVGWVKKYENDATVADGGDGGGGKGQKGKVTGDNWKNRGYGRKENWKDRQRKQDRGDENKKDPGQNYGSQTQQLNGGTLLNALKASSPGSLRYSREELFLIGQLPASNVKPPTLDEVIDKGNTISPLLFRTKEKSSRRHDDGDGNDHEEEHVPRRGDRDRERDRESGDRDRGDRHERGERDRGHRHAGADNLQGERPQERVEKGVGGWNQSGQEAWAQAPTKKGDDQWDMPDTSSANNWWDNSVSGANQSMGGMGDGDICMTDFTLGDIRKAEKSLNKGMSMSDYKAQLRAAGGSQASEAPTTHPSSEQRPSRSNAVPSGEPSMFAEEDEDLSRNSSRGFSKWFKNQPECVEESTSASLDPPQHSSATAAPSRAPAAPLEKDRRQQRLHPHAHGAPAPPEPNGSASSSQARRSSRSMLGKAEQETDGNLASTASVAGVTGAVPAQPLAAVFGGEGKLSVAELFSLAQGKYMPPMPTSANRKDIATADAEAAHQMRTAMASQWMWAAAANAQAVAANAQSSMSAGGAYPGYPPLASSYGGLPPAYAAGYGLQSCPQYSNVHNHTLLQRAGQAGQPQGVYGATRTQFSTVQETSPAAADLWQQAEMQRRLYSPAHALGAGPLGSATLGDQSAVAPLKAGDASGEAEDDDAGCSQS